MPPSKSEIWHGTNLKIGENEMKKYKVIIASAKDVKLLNDKIAIDMQFAVGTESLRIVSILKWNGIIYQKL